jgi:hypothetical protein
MSASVIWIKAVIWLKAEVLDPGTRTEGQGGKAEAPSVPGDASPRPRSGYVQDVVHSEHFRVVTPYGSVKSILDNNLDARVLKRTPDSAVILHPNIRGPRYYH